MDDACSTQGAESTTHITKAQSQSRDDDLGPQLNGTIWLLTTLAALFLGLRIYCKLLRRRGLWWDDYFLLASWVSASPTSDEILVADFNFVKVALAVSAIMLSVGVSLGLGKHNNDINPETFQGVVMFSYIAGFCSVLATAWSKTSFAITLLRISNGWVKMFVWFTIITVNLVLGANGTIQWAQCWPVTKLWDASVPGKCLPSEVVKDYNTFVSGKCHHSDESCELDCYLPTYVPTYSHTYRSIFWRNGHCTSIITMEDHLGNDNAQEGEAWSIICHEHGSLVSLMLSMTYPAS